MGALDTGYKYGDVIADKKGNIRQSVKTMGGSFDANQMVENLVKAKEFPITKLEDKNEINTKLLDELYATKEDFKTPFDILKGLSNPTSTSDDINYFSQTLPSLSSGSGTIKPSELADFKVTDKNIAHQKFSFEVLQKASSDVMVSTKTLSQSDLMTNPITSDGTLKLSFTGRDEVKSANTVLTADLETSIITIDGNLTLKNKDGTEDIDIALSSSMTLETVANEINQSTYQTGVKAVLGNDDNTGKNLS